MRQALRRNLGPRRNNLPHAQPHADIVFVPAPSGGWNTELPVPELPPSLARRFENWMPSGTSLAIRKGYADHVTGISDPVETLLAYNAGSASALFAAAGTSIYNVSSPGAVGSAVVTSLTSARFSYVNFTTSGGSFMWLCNGVDDPRHWNGSAWATPSLTVTTYTDNDISYVAAFKERLFFIFKNTLTMGYLPVQNIAGTIANYPLGAVFRYGGRLVALGSLSRDGGDGLDDFFVALSSEGEVAVFQGFNPASATEWALVGVYYVGEPIGDRPLVELGDDLGVITQNGFVSVSRVMSGAQQQNESMLSAPIATPLREALSTGQSLSGWEGLYVPLEGLLIINAPQTTETAEQYVRYRATGGWGKFTGWNFETFEVFNGECYAGTSDGRVVKCFSGNDDDGADITAALETAWTTLGWPGVKTLQEIRAIVTTATRAVIRMVGRTDFRDSPPLPAWPASTITNALIWGTGIWGTNLWGGEDASTRNWRAFSGEGHSVSIALEARSNQGAYALNGFNLRFERGGQV